MTVTENPITPRARVRLANRVPRAVTLQVVLMAAATAVTTLAVHVLLWAFLTDSGQGLYACAVSRVGTSPDGAAAAGYTCTAGAYPSLLVWTGSALAALVMVSAVLITALPAWRVRRSGLVALDGLPAPELRSELHRLTDAAGVRHRPRFLVDPVAQSAGGLAFGRNGRPLIRLDAGLIAQRRSDPAAFRAVVVHELAHLRNRDVTATYLTVAVWRAYILVTLAPSIVTALTPVVPEREQLTLIAIGAVPTLLVYLARTAVLRRRELHADQTTAWLLGTARPEDALPPLRRGRIARLPLPLRNHPSPSVRAASLAAPAALHRPRFTDHLVAGAALQMTTYCLAYALFFGLGVGPVTVLVPLWGVGFALIMAVALGEVRRWRAAGGTGSAALMPAGAGLAIGVGVGYLLEPHALLGWPPTRPLLLLILLASLAGAFVLLGSWADQVWSLTRAVRRKPVRAAALTAVCGTVLLLAISLLSRAAALPATIRVLEAEFSWAWAQLQGTVDGGWTEWDGPLLVGWLLVVQAITALQQFGWPVVPVLLWAVPLLLAPLRSDRRLLTAGLIGAGGWLGYSLLVRAGIRESLTEAVRDTEAVRMVLSAWEVSGVAAAQFAVCLVVAARRPTTLPRSLIAGAVTGGACGVLLWLFFVVDACVPVLEAAKTACPASVDLDYGATVLQMVMMANCVAAPLGHLGGVLLRLLFRGTRGRSSAWSTGTRQAEGRAPSGDTRQGGTLAPRWQRICSRMVAFGFVTLMLLPRGGPPPEPETQSASVCLSPMAESGTVPPRYPRDVSVPEQHDQLPHQCIHRG